MLVVTVTSYIMGQREYPTHFEEDIKKEEKERHTDCFYNFSKSHLKWVKTNGTDQGKLMLKT
jgi:hypothetical protein